MPANQHDSAQGEATSASDTNLSPHSVVDDHMPATEMPATYTNPFQPSGVEDHMHREMPATYRNPFHPSGVDDHMHREMPATESEVGGDAAHVERGFSVDGVPRDDRYMRLKFMIDECHRRQLDADRRHEQYTERVRKTKAEVVAGQESRQSQLLEEVQQLRNELQHARQAQSEMEARHRQKIEELKARYNDVKREHDGEIEQLRADYEARLGRFKEQKSNVDQESKRDVQRLLEDSELLQAELFRAKETAILCGDKALTLSSDLVHLKSVHQQIGRTVYGELNAFHTEFLPQLYGQIMEAVRTQASNTSHLSQVDFERRRELEAENEQLREELRLSRSAHSVASAAVERERTEAMRLLNMVHELKGNIRVGVRIRPFTDRERKAGRHKAAGSVSVDKRTLYCSNQKFEFDNVFGPESTQVEVFDEVSTLVRSVVDGYSVCVFAYGQTGSGKTYTMEGPASSRGINFRALELLFQLMEQRSATYEVRMRIGMIEIYNEKAKDLLNQGADVDISYFGEARNLTLRRVDHETVDGVWDVLRDGYRNRAIRNTQSNSQSSRSHCLAIIYVDMKHKVNGSQLHGRLNLIDLAGSENVKESGVQGQGMKEARNINQSLSVLGNVIKALHDKRRHIPYQESKLTCLLQNSLGGNSKVMMIVQLNPSSAPRIQSESLRALKFGQRAHETELGRAKQNSSTSTQNTAPTTSTSSRRGSTLQTQGTASTTNAGLPLSNLTNRRSTLASRRSSIAQKQAKGAADKQGGVAPSTSTSQLQARGTHAQTRAPAVAAAASHQGTTRARAGSASGRSVRRPSYSLR